MRQYIPSRTELTMFIVGLMLGSVLTFWANGWQSIVIVAPLVITIELVRYILEKRKENYEQQLAKAKDIKELVGKNGRTS